MTTKSRIASAIAAMFMSSPAVAADNLIENPKWLPNTMSLTVSTPETPVIHGQTTLPDGTALVTVLTRTRGGDHTRYTAEANAIVTNGKFETEPFTEDGGDLKSGEYLIDIEARPPDADINPAVVESDRGNFKVLLHVVLSGQFYKHSSLGPRVEYRIKFFVRTGNPKYAKEEYQREQESHDTSNLEDKTPFSLSECFNNQMTRGFFNPLN
jgi:hypothetical protein